MRVVLLWSNYHYVDDLIEWNDRPTRCERVDARGRAAITDFDVVLGRF